MAACVLHQQENNGAEKNYHSSKLELMAMVWAMERLRAFLIGIHFTLVTDCQALVYLNAHRTQKPQIVRWYDLVQEYNFTVRHRPGALMTHVDSLSRGPVEPPTDTMEDVTGERLDVFLAISVEDQVLAMQAADTDLKELVTILQKPSADLSREERNRVKDFALMRGRLVRKIGGTDNRQLFVIPKCMRKSVVVQSHDLMGHFSVDRTVSKIQQQFWFPRMRNYVRKHISQCFECISNKTPAGKREGLLNPIP